MPARDAKARQSRPRSPDVPARLDDPPQQLSSGDTVDCVRADESVSIADPLVDVTTSESIWEGVDFSDRLITGFRAVDTVFSRCDFSGAVLDGAQLTRVQFSGCRLTGTVLSGTQLLDVLVEDSAANLANFRAAKAERLSIERTSLHEADFYEAGLKHSALLDSELTQANFTKISAPEIELHGSTFEGLRGAGSLAGARIDTAQIIPMGAALVAALGVTVVDRSS